MATRKGLLKLTQGAICLRPLTFLKGYATTMAPYSCLRLKVKRKKYESYFGILFPKIGV